MAKFIFKPNEVPAYKSCRGITGKSFFEELKHFASISVPRGIYNILLETSATPEHLEYLFNPRAFITNKIFDALKSTAHQNYSPKRYGDLYNQLFGEIVYNCFWAEPRVEKTARSKGSIDLKDIVSATDLMEIAKVISPTSKEPEGGDFIAPTIPNASLTEIVTRHVAEVINNTAWEYAYADKTLQGVIKELGFIVGAYEFLCEAFAKNKALINDPIFESYFKVNGKILKKYLSYDHRKAFVQYASQAIEMFAQAMFDGILGFRKFSVESVKLTGIELSKKEASDIFADETWKAVLKDVVYPTLDTEVETLNKTIYSFVIQSMKLSLNNLDKVDLPE